MVDRISLLPNEILTHVLSFVPSDDAVTTSVLSKRWRGLWTLVPVLDFDDTRYLKNDRHCYHFRKFVDTTISARDFQQPIKKFRLKCVASAHYLGYYDVIHWVDTVMQRGIEILEIDFPIPDPVLLLQFSSCTTLDLRLSGWLDGGFLPDFPSLKTLHFNGVCFCLPESFIKFLFGCPNLENLEAKDMIFLGHLPYFENEFKRLPKLVRANISHANYLPIDKYTDEIPAFPNLTHLELVFDININWRVVFAMLQQCPKLQILILDVRKHIVIHEACCPYPGYVPQHLVTHDEANWPYPAFVPQCISSNLRKCAMPNFKGTETELLFAKYVMENSASLQDMKISCMNSLNPQKKLWIVIKLESCSRRSVTCELSFE